MLYISKAVTLFANEEYCLKVVFVSFDENTESYSQWIFSSKFIHSAYMADTLSQSIAYLNDLSFKKKVSLPKEKLIVYYQDWLAQYALKPTLKANDGYSLTNYFAVKQSLWEQFREFLETKQLTPCNKPQSLSTNTLGNNDDC
jgi:hypothetical protein